MQSATTVCAHSRQPRAWSKKDAPCPGHRMSGRGGAPVGELGFGRLNRSASLLRRNRPVATRTDEFVRETVSPLLVRGATAMTVPAFSAGPLSLSSKVPCDNVNALGCQKLSICWRMSRSISPRLPCLEFALVLKRVLPLDWPRFLPDHIVQDNLLSVDLLLPDRLHV